LREGWASEEVRGETPMLGITAWSWTAAAVFTAITSEIIAAGAAFSIGDGDGDGVKDSVRAPEGSTAFDEGT